MSTTLSPRSPALTEALAAAAVVFIVMLPLAAVAVPAPEPVTGTFTACPVGMGGMASRLRYAGLSAQAANVVTQLAYRDCVHSTGIR